MLGEHKHSVHSRNTLKRTEDISLDKNLYINAHRSIIYNTQKVKKKKKKTDKKAHTKGQIV